MMLRLHTFGGLWVEGADGSRIPSGPRGLALLAELASAHGRPVPRDRLLLHLWPESTDERARHALNQAMYRLRRELGEDPIIVGTADYAIDRRLLASDIGDLLDAHERQDQAAMAAAYRGPFLDGFYLEDAGEFERWVEAERVRYHALAVSAFEGLARSAAAHGDTAAALAAWQRLGELEPLNGRVALGRMEALAASGDRAAAQRAGEEFTRRYEGEVGSTPDAAIAGFLARLRAGDWGSRLAVPQPATVPPVPVGDSAPPTADRSGRRTHGRLIAAMVIVLAFAVLALVRGTRGSARLTTGSGVLLADIVNETGDSTLRALQSAAVIGLQQSRHVTVFSRTRVGETLARMGRTLADTTIITESLAREIAQRENLSLVLVIGVGRLDSTYVLTSRLVDPATGTDLRTERVTGARRDRILDALDDLIDRTRGALGEARAAVAGADQPLPLATTSSLDALKAYSDGLAAWSAARYLEARADWERAVMLDSSFALAHASLADYWYVAANDRPRGEASLRRALAGLDRLTEREQLRVKAGAARLRQRNAEAIALARTMAERYPSRDSWYNLGSSLIRDGQCREAIPALRRAIEMDTLYANSWINLATCFHLDGELQQALDAYAAAGRADTTILVRFNINHEWGTAFVKTGRLEAADSAFRRMLDRAPTSRSRGLRSLAYLAMYRGRYQEALTHLSEAITLNTSGDVRLSAWRDLVIRGNARLTAGDVRGGRQDIERAYAQVSSLSLDPGYLLHIGIALVRAGRVDLAERVRTLAESRMQEGNQADRQAHALLSAWILLARSRPADALVAMEEVPDDWFPGYRLSIAMDARLALKEADSVLAIGERLLKQWNFGFEGQEQWVRALLTMASAAELKGDLPSARAALSRYLDRWNGGDATMPDVIQARRTLERLQQSAGR